MGRKKKEIEQDAEIAPVENTEVEESEVEEVEVPQFDTADLSPEDVGIVLPPLEDNEEAPATEEDEDSEDEDSEDEDSEDSEDAEEDEAPVAEIPYYDPKKYRGVFNHSEDPYVGAVVVPPGHVLVFDNIEIYNTMCEHDTRWISPVEEDAVAEICAAGLVNTAFNAIRED